MIAVNQAAKSVGWPPARWRAVFAPALGARGGGKPDLAQGAGGSAARLPEAFAAIEAGIMAGSAGDSRP